MCSLSMMEDKLPPGFRFHPKDEELICDYLQKKISGEKIESSSEIPVVIEVDLNKCEPWDIPDVACVGGKDWYFFSLRDRKYATGLRTNRATVSGYWKATGKDRQVTRKSKLVGMRKTLVFYQGRAPKGRKTDWVMHEFRVEDGNSDPCQLSKKEDWVLCKVFCKNRSISANTIEDFGFNDTSCSTSTYLPPLIDIFAVFDEKTPMNLEEECEQQVTFLPKLPSFSQIENHEPKTNFCQYVHLSDFHSGLNPFSFENDSIKTVLGNFSKLEKVLKMEEMPRLTEIGSESFLSDDDAISIWETI